MSRDGGKPGRTMAPDEAELWGRLAQSVDKVKSKQRVTSHAGGADTASPRKAQPAQPPQRSRQAAYSAPRPPPPPAPKPSRVPPLAEVDRRAVRQLASGKQPIDARLDLHGVRRREAHAQLRAFLIAAQLRGCRTVLVITGKGAETPGRDHL